MKKVNSDASVTLLTYLDGPSGFSHIWDLGYFAGQLLSSKDSKAEVEGILKFFNATSAESEYNFVNYGMEGVHYTIKDGLPVADGQGQAGDHRLLQRAVHLLHRRSSPEVDSPLAPMSYNLQTREEMKVLYKKPSKVNLYDVLQSDGWTAFWGRTANEFGAKEVEAITGKISMDDFRAYQQSLPQGPRRAEVVRGVPQELQGHLRQVIADGRPAGPDARPPLLKHRSKGDDAS